MNCSPGRRLDESPGETPKDRPLTPEDFWATIYRHLGIDIHHGLLDYAGRPKHILDSGETIRELV